MHFVVNFGRQNISETKIGDENSLFKGHHFACIPSQWLLPHLKGRSQNFQEIRAFRFMRENGMLKTICKSYYIGLPLTSQLSQEHFRSAKGSSGRLHSPFPSILILIIFL